MALRKRESTFMLSPICWTGSTVCGRPDLLKRAPLGSCHTIRRIAGRWRRCVLAGVRIAAVGKRVWLDCGHLVLWSASEMYRMLLFDVLSETWNF